MQNNNTIPFIKAHGIGNDFVIIDLLNNQLEYNWYELAKKMCDRNFGIGADGLILVLPSAAADYRMRIINSDGTEPEMCGNGIRCFARYLLDNDLARTSMTIETLAGVMKIDVIFEQALGTGFRVDMGRPILNAKDIPVNGFEDNVVSEQIDVDGEMHTITCVSMGNPHCIIYTDDVDSIHLEKIGPKIENHPTFPKKINVEFVQIMNNGEIKIRVWERGAGITLACGTGACASVAASILDKKIDRIPTIAHLPGGDLSIEWNENGHIYMTGPAEIVFTGTYCI